MMINMTFLKPTLQARRLLSLGGGGGGWAVDSGSSNDLCAIGLELVAAGSLTCRILAGHQGASVNSLGHKGFSGIELQTNGVTS